MKSEGQIQPENVIREIAKVTVLEAIPEGSASKRTFKVFDAAKV
jgi:hypothetical protein